MTQIGKIDTYIDNCRQVKNFRDDNFTIKNYRIFDLMARELDSEEMENKEMENREMENKEIVKWDNKNFILYGPPGTGKTYNSARYAVAIVEEKDIFEIEKEDYDAVFSRYKKYINDGLIAFTTFHQSYSYEEFIEGIRPVVLEEDEAESTREIEYEITDGIFKSFCDKAATPIHDGENPDLGIGKNPKIWKVSLAGAGDNPVRTECLENGHIRIGWDEYGEHIKDATDYSKHGGKSILNAFYNRMQVGDIIMSCYSSKTIDAIGVVTGEPEWHDEYSNYKRLRKVNWLVKDIDVDIVDFNAGRLMTAKTIHMLRVNMSDVWEILGQENDSLSISNMKIPNRVFIIDEINRGNISKIFGELITLIEPSKRLNAKEESRAILPYSGKRFAVPDNVYIIGTMNTADRSIALMDTALRRRFQFIEMMPDAEVLHELGIDKIDQLDIGKMLNTINERITFLFDREHTIGHSFFTSLKGEEATIENLAGIFEKSIIPLLQEYFYEDYEKIQLVLGDNQKSKDEYKFIQDTDVDVRTIFKGDIEDRIDLPEKAYKINKEAFHKIESYIEIYTDIN